MAAFHTLAHSSRRTCAVYTRTFITVALLVYEYEEKTGPHAVSVDGLTPDTRICAAGVDGNAHACTFSPAEFVSRNKKWSGWSGIMSNATHFEYKSSQCLPMCSPCQEEKAILGLMPISVSSKRCTGTLTYIYIFLYYFLAQDQKKTLIFSPDLPLISDSNQCACSEVGKQTYCSCGLTNKLLRDKRL